MKKGIAAIIIGIKSLLAALHVIILAMVVSRLLLLHKYLITGLPFIHQLQCDYLMVVSGEGGGG